MNSRRTVLDHTLNRAELRWKWVRFLRYALLVASLVCCLLMLFSGVIALHWVYSRLAAIIVWAIVGLAGVAAWFVGGLVIFARPAERGWLAGAIEQVDRRLLDRLNTLLFLQRRRNQPYGDGFAQRIASQTQEVLAQGRPESPFPMRNLLAHFATFLALLTGTILLLVAYPPLQRIGAAELQRAEERAAVEEKPLEIPPPAMTNVEQNLAWGEVRITDPGADLKVTKVDVVPLQIEAAANQSLKTVAWYSAANGGAESRHELPAPTDPRYAVYQPTVYLDELKLSDWDVLTYYAKASTEKKDNYASDVYFLEVRPFREDILKTPGGEGGKAYKALNDMTSLIQRQQQVIRQTHQHVQHPSAPENVRDQDRKKLSEGENDLRDSAEHLYSEMAAKMENKPIGEALDNLAQAEKSLGQASEALEDNALPEAQNRERSALLQLVNARKIFQKAVSDHPDQFQEPANPDEESTPVAESQRKLNQMAEFRNEAKAARDVVNQTLDAQKKLDQQARKPAHNPEQLAKQEKDLEKALEEFQSQHPSAFHGTEEEAKRAEQAMNQAAQSLQGGGTNSNAAERQLEKLGEQMQSQSGARELADAYRLKQMLDRQIQALDHRAKSEGGTQDKDARQTAAEARETISQLKKAAEESPTRDAFGQPLRDALKGANQGEIESKLARVEKPSPGAPGGDPLPLAQRAGEARDALQKVSTAFDQSQPKSLQMARQSDSLKPGPQDSLQQGMSELASLIQQAENQHQAPATDQAKQARQTLADLKDGLAHQPENADQVQLILAELEKALRPDNPLDVAMLKKLANQLQHFSAEATDHLARKEDQPVVNNIDPASLPPAYRGRIQKYFRKLSEP